MSRPDGMSRTRRRSRRKVATKSGAAKLIDNKPVEPVRNVFDDFDLSDIKLNVDTSANTSLKSAKNCLTSVANESSIIDENEQKIEGFSTRSLINNFNEFHFESDLSLLSTKPDPTASTSSATFNKPSLIPSDKTPKTSTSNKRKNVSGIFNDFDLSDIKTDDSFASFQSSRKVVKTKDLNIGEDLDLNEHKTCLSFASSKSFTNTNNLRPLARSDTKRNKAFNSPLISKGFNKCNVFGDFDFSDIKAKSFSSFTNSKNSLKSNNSNVFGDLDLSDLKTSESFVSFQSTRNIINKELKPATITRNPEEVFPQEEQESKENNNEVQETKSCECDSLKHECDSLFTTTDFNNSDLSLKIDCNVNNVHKVNNCFEDIDLSDLQHMSQSVIGFESANKAFKSFSKSSSKRTDDSALANSDVSGCQSVLIQESERKNIISNIFEDLDLSDVKFNESLPSFKKARIAFKAPSIESSPETARQSDIDWNEMDNIFDQSFGDSQNFMTSSPKPKKSSAKVKFEDSENLENDQKEPKSELSFGLSESDSFAECADRLVETMNLTEITAYNRTEIDNRTDDCDSRHLANNCDTDEMNSSFTFRTDFESFNESSTDEFLKNCNEVKVKKEDEQVIGSDFKGFRSGNGRPFVLTEQQLIDAQHVFKDIEEWLMNEITSNRLDINKIDEDFYSYSQKFITKEKNIGLKNIELVLTDNEMSATTRHNS